MSMDKSIVKGLQAQMRDKVAEAEAGLAQARAQLALRDTRIRQLEALVTQESKQGAPGGAGMVAESPAASERPLSGGSWGWGPGAEGHGQVGVEGGGVGGKMDEELRVVRMNGNERKPSAEGEMKDVSGLLGSGEGRGAGQERVTAEMESCITAALVAVEDLIEILSADSLRADSLDSELARLEQSLSLRNPQSTVERQVLALESLARIACAYLQGDAERGRSGKLPLLPPLSLSAHLTGMGRHAAGACSQVCIQMRKSATGLKGWVSGCLSQALSGCLSQRAGVGDSRDGYAPVEMMSYSDDMNE